MKNTIFRTASAVAALAAGGIAVAAANDPFVGRYTGDGDGGGTEITVTRKGDGYTLDAAVYGDRGCAGSLSASARPVNATTIRATKANGDGSTCRFTMTKKGASWSVATEDCGTWSGLSCGWDGTATKVSAAPSKPTPAPQRRAPAARSDGSADLDFLFGGGLQDGGPAGSLDEGPRRPPAGPAWVATYDMSWVQDASSARALILTGCRGSYTMNIGIVGQFGAEPDGPTGQPRHPWTRAFANVSTVTVRPLDRAGRPLATILLKRESEGGGQRILAGLTTAQTAALKASSSIQAVSSAWSLTFSATGSAKAITDLHCITEGD